MHQQRYELHRRPDLTVGSFIRTLRMVKYDETHAHDQVGPPRIYDAHSRTIVTESTRWSGIRKRRPFLPPHRAEVAAKVQVVRIGFST